MRGRVALFIVVGATFLAAALAALSACGRAARHEGSSTLMTLQGRVTARWVAAPGDRELLQRGTFAVTSRGDLRLETTFAKDTLMGFPAGSHLVDIYSAATHRDYGGYLLPNGSFVGAVMASTWSPVARGAGLPLQMPLPDYEGLLKVALAGAGTHVNLESITYEGRPAWYLSALLAHWSLRAIVDKATRFPLYGSARTRSRGHFDGGLAEVRVDHLRWNRPLPAATFAPPPGAAKQRQLSDYVHFTTLPRVAARLGWACYVPHWLPPGYTLAAVATLPATNMLMEIPGATMGGPYIDRSRLPDTEVELLYRRGFASLDIHVWPTAYNWEAWAAAHHTTGLASVRLASGAFAGELAYYWTHASTAGLGVFMTSPHLIFLRGDPSTRDLLRVANSLEPYR